MTAERVRLLVVAKAPQAGAVKTRLGTTIGDRAAAEVAAAALLDTLAACRAAVGATRCLLALSGDLAGAHREVELRAALTGWTVRPQRGDHFGARLAAAHADAGPGAVIQVGMDTPQVTPELLRSAASGLDDHDAVLGPAPDGGWWVLGLRDPGRAVVLRDVPMSTPTTGADTRAALVGAGLTVGTAPALTDVDTAEDAGLVAGQAPASEFASAWRAVGQP
jgi:uncharacterized protein